jgi:hypothetical protein
MKIRVLQNKNRNREADQAVRRSKQGKIKQSERQELSAQKQIKARD